MSSRNRRRLPAETKSGEVRAVPHPGDLQVVVAPHPDDLQVVVAPHPDDLQAVKELCLLIGSRDRVSEQSDAFDLDFDDVAGFHKYLWIPAKTDAAWSTGRDDVSNLERHHL